MELKDIGKQIRQKRKAKAWTQEQLAEKTGLSVPYIGMIERGEKLPKLETFIRIANALEVSADELLSGVISTGYKVRLSLYSDKVRQLNDKERKTLYDIIEIFYKNHSPS